MKGALAALAIALLAAAACGDAPPPAPAPAGARAPEPLWKRTSALLADLAAALELDPSACAEPGGACADVHRVALGEAEPFARALYQRPEAPLATTPLALERVVWRRCAERVELDRRGPAAVFTALDLEAPSLDPRDAAIAATVAELYRRFHGRAPGAPEVEAIAALADDGAGGPTAEGFAKAACFAVGTSTEFLFY